MTQTFPGSPALVFCDGGGGHHSHDFAGGWGFHIEYPNGDTFENFGGAIPTTNNKMELTAAIRALASFPSGAHIVMHCDSQYVVYGITQWIYSWVQKGWQTADEKPVSNKDLWELLHSIASKRNVTWVWVKGHAGHVGNERADVLATEGRYRIMEKHGKPCKRKKSFSSSNAWASITQTRTSDQAG